MNLSEIYKEENEIRELEFQIEQKRLSLSKNIEKFNEKNINSSHKSDILKRNINLLYDRNFQKTSWERSETSGIDFGSFFGSSIFSEIYIMKDDIFKWIDQSLPKYEGRIGVTSTKEFVLENDNIIPDSEEGRLKRKRIENQELFLKAINSDKEDKEDKETKTKRYLTGKQRQKFSINRESDINFDLVMNHFIESLLSRYKSIVILDICAAKLKPTLDDYGVSGKLIQDNIFYIELECVLIR